MAKVIVYTNENGNVSVCYPAPGLTVGEVLSKDCPDEAIIVDDSVLPTGPANSHYFSAWRLNGKKISVDMDVAKAIHKDLIRMARNEKFADLDAQTQRHNTAYLLSNRKGDKAAADAALDAMENVEALKQQLRDVTDDPAIDAAKNCDELFATIPDFLK